MARVSLRILENIEGFIAAALVDIDSGLPLISEGDEVDLELASALNTEIVRAHQRFSRACSFEGDIEDILTTMVSNIHVIRTLSSQPSLFIFLILDRDKANLAMARHELREFERNLELS